MKFCTKISCSIITLISVISGDAFADKKPEYKSKLSGYEFGVGVPLVTPFTGYNFFVGYVNKKADSFWGRRLGFRADFTVPSDLRLQGTISDAEKNKYAVDFSGKVMGFNVKLSDFSDKKVEFDAFKDDKKQPISIGKETSDLTLEIHNQNIGFLVDFYPFADTWFLGGIRFSGGYYIGDFKISANLDFNNDVNYSYKANAQNYLYAQIEKGSELGVDFHWKYHGPYAGIGFDIGIWRGFKFFVDAGAVFANTPRFTEENIHDKNLHLRARYDVYDKDGNLYSLGSDMVDILPNGIYKAPTDEQVEQIVSDTVGMAVSKALTRYPDEYAEVAKVLPIGGKAPEEFGHDLIAFWNNTDPSVPNPEWIDVLLTKSGEKLSEYGYTGTPLTEAIADIKTKWHEEGGIKDDINDAWNKYDREKQRSIKDINKFLDDYSIMPMIKIGFMYRF